MHSNFCPAEAAAAEQIQIDFQTIHYGNGGNMDMETARALVQGRPWHHDFEIVPGVRTHGTYNPGELWEMLDVPQDLSGRAFADVGASNGYFSFEARQRGARVVAFDFRHRDNSGFGLAQHINGLSDIEHHQINVLELSSERFGQFDIVLALGLLYHVADPFRAIANLADITRQTLFVESYCIDEILPPELRRQPIMRFISDPGRFASYAHNEHAHASADASNFWGFTSECLKRMLQDVGFDTTIVMQSGDRVLLSCQKLEGSPASDRLGIAYGTVASVATGANPDDHDAWVVF
jgi:tRNA (mo5U34)-methyltransferase